MIIKLDDVSVSTWSLRVELENEILCRVLQVSSEQAIKHHSNTGGHPDVQEFGMGGKGEPINVRGVLWA